MLETVKGFIMTAAGRSPAVRHRTKFTGFQHPFPQEADITMAAEAKESNEGKIL